MKIDSINPQSFNGNVRISFLSKQQQNIFNKVSQDIEKNVKPVKKLNLFIYGSTKPDMIVSSVNVKPKYMHIITNDVYGKSPTAHVAKEIKTSNDLLATVKQVILDHNKVMEDNKKTTIFSKILNIFSKSK